MKPNTDELLNDISDRHKQRIIQDVRCLPLKVVHTHPESLTAYQWMAFGNSEWLNTSCVATVLVALHRQFPRLGFVSLAFTTLTDAEKRQRMARSYGAFTSQQI
ncbi:TPA: hypothetical protein N0F65_009868 [Lagenidium giganteum]|uniref:Uncharacterized protein n=1 Tax=Lagenidium giganteum TaxID=4803 RepID=A0AAV2YR71_9STRA|nr:TPA: hypothetical protein N0F65_009868 [Lagenidium giganteum]